MLEEVGMASPAELRKGPRGGGRDRDGIWHHVIEAERAYARKIGVRHPPFEVNDKSALKAIQRRATGCRGMERQLRDPAHGLACGRSPLGNRRPSKLIAVVPKVG